MSRGVTALGEDALRRVAALYEVGPLVRGERLAVKGSSPGYYLLVTPVGRYFLKHYHRIGEGIEAGLGLLRFLAERGYPAARVLATRNGATHVRLDGADLALFEYVDIAEERALTPAQAGAMGEALGELHALTGDYALPDGGVDEAWVERWLTGHRPALLGSAMGERALAFAERVLPELGVPKELPRAACHQEFLRQHVRFREGRIAAVVDWDLAGRDYAFRDLSCAMKESLREGDVDFALLGALVRGYESRRRLTEWEREHLYHGLCFAALKYLVWALGSRARSVPLEEGSAALPVRRVVALEEMGERVFGQRLEDALGGDGVRAE